MKNTVAKMDRDALSLALSRLEQWSAEHGIDADDLAGAIQRVDAVVRTLPADRRDVALTERADVERALMLSVSSSLVVFATKLEAMATRLESNHGS